MSPEPRHSTFLHQAQKPYFREDHFSGGRPATLDGKEVRLRISSDTNIEGVSDRSVIKAGMKVEAVYKEPKDFNPALGFDVIELTVQP